MVGCIIGITVMAAGETIKIDDFESVGLGIMLLFVSLIFKYGAEISENKKLEKTEE